MELDEGWTKGKASSVSSLKGHIKLYKAFLLYLQNSGYWHFWQPAADVFVCLWQPLRLLGIRFKVEGGILPVVMCSHVNKFGERDNLIAVQHGCSRRNGH